MKVRWRAAPHTRGEHMFALAMVGESGAPNVVISVTCSYSKKCFQNNQMKRLGRRWHGNGLAAPCFN